MAAFVIFAAASTVCLAQAQQAAPEQSPPAAPAPAVAPPKAYKSVAVKSPSINQDPSFATFRKQLADIAQRKDRMALQKFVVVKNFFREGEGGDKADPKSSSFDNFASAISLGDNDGTGWEILGAAAAEPTLEADPDHAGVMCGPAGPQIDEQSFIDLIKDTGTDADEWGYPNVDKLQVRSAAKEDAPVTDTLGMNLVRVYPEQTLPASPTMVRVVTPSGQLGYVPIIAVLPIVTDQLCYIKDAGGWKIAGYAGGQ